MKHKIGQLVVNRKLGLGKVTDVYGELVTVFFKNETENPRVINVGAVPMEIAAEQSDADLDELMSKPRRRPAKPRKPSAKRTAAAASATPAAP